MESGSCPPPPLGGVRLLPIKDALSLGPGVWAAALRSLLVTVAASLLKSVAEAKACLEAQAVKAFFEALRALIQKCCINLCAHTTPLSAQRSGMVCA